MLSLSTKTKISSFHVVALARTTKKCSEMRNARVARAKLWVFKTVGQICTFVAFLFSSSLLKVPLLLLCDFCGKIPDLFVFSFKKSTSKHSFVFFGKKSSSTAGGCSTRDQIYCACSCRQCSQEKGEQIIIGFSNTGNIVSSRFKHREQRVDNTTRLAAECFWTKLLVLKMRLNTNSRV